MRKIFAGFIVVVVLAVTATVVGCGGSDTGSADEATAAAEADPAFVPAPTASTVVFTVSLAGASYEYTWADVSGSGVLGAQVTQSYLKDTEDQDPEVWSGVWLRTVLADVEARSGVTLDDKWKLDVAAADSYVSSLAVGDVRDAKSNYLLATDPIRGCAVEDPADATEDDWYEPTYVRICTNGDYGNTAFPARLVVAAGSMTVVDASGNEVSAAATVD